jgi:hypothetical protein
VLQSSTPGTFSGCVAGAVSGDSHHGRDELVVVDTAIVGAGHSAQLGAAILGRVGLDHLGPVVGEAVLQVDAGDRGRELAQVAGGSADQARELAEAPVCRSHRLGRAGQHQGEALRVVPGRLDPNLAALERAGLGAIGAGLHGTVKVAEAEIALVGRTGKPLRTDTSDTLAAAKVGSVRGLPDGARAKGRAHHGKSPRRAGREPLSPPLIPSRSPEPPSRSSRAPGGMPSAQTVRSIRRRSCRA